MSPLQRWLLVVWLWCLWGPGAAAQAATVTLQHADVSATVAGVTQPASRLGLPYHWDKLHGAVSGQARFRLRVEVADTSAPLALYIPRLGNTYAIRVNGDQLASFGTVPANLHDDSATEPRYFVIPPRLLAPVTLIDIDIGATGGRQGGLSQVTAGPEQEVYAIYQANHFWQISGARVVVIVSVVLGLLALLLWFRQRDPAYLAYGVGELLWAVQTVRVLVEHAPLPWPWWGVIPLAAFNAAPPLLCRFALTIMGFEKGRVARMANVLVVLAVPAALWTMLGGALWLPPLFQLLITITSIAMAWVVISAAVRTNVYEKRILGVAVGLIVACALRDVLVLRLSANNYDVVPWIRFAWVGFGVSLAWIIAERLRKESAAARAANDNLSEQLRARDAELGAAFERQRAEEKLRGAAEERQRLMRDLHDGLGSQLVGALRVAQQPTASRDDITRQLRGAVDQLKITVDAMQETDGDIASVLGASRYRLAPRLQAAAIQLQWDVSRLPQMPGWGVRQSYQLQMILFEAFTNMVVHSAATSARLSAQQVDQDGTPTIEITITDNGQGFDATGAQGGRGLANMRQRAASLGATLQVTSTPGDTRVRLTIPADAPPAAS